MDKVAVVTGANKGLGFYLVKTLCHDFKGTVYLTSRDADRGQAACNNLKKLDYDVKYHQLDISDDKSVKRFCSFLQSENIKINLLINNAGILFLKDATETKEYQAEKTLEINFFSLVNFTESVLPFVKNDGCILNISSSSGHLSRIPSIELRNNISNPNLSLESLKKLMEDYITDVKLNIEKERWGESPYVVSKVGVNAYTFMLNKRLSNRGIIVNCIHPGYVMSDMTRGSGSVTPEQAAQVVTRIALQTKEGGLFFWHTGEVVPWDGPDPRGYIDKK